MFKNRNSGVARSSFSMSTESETSHTSVSRTADGQPTLSSLIKRKDFKELEWRARECPDEFAEISSYNLGGSRTKCHPLHFLCKTGECPVSTLQAVIKAAPVAMSSRDSKWNSTPLHIACSSGMSLDCVRILLASHPGAATVADLDGNLPAHVAVSCAQPEVAVEVWCAYESKRANKKKLNCLDLAFKRPDHSRRVVTTIYEFFSLQKDWRQMSHKYVPMRNALVSGA